MRVWDVAPGYLNRQSLLGEHRELHGLRNILVEGKAGYARHPETLRWHGCLSGLASRHALLAAEMRLRGYTDRTPIEPGPGNAWPATFVTPPIDQFALLKAKYTAREPGRIPLPRDAQQLWAQHKYSVMARDPAHYRRLGRRVAALPRGAGMPALAEELVVALRQRPAPGRLVNALEHMWGHVARHATAAERAAAAESPPAMLAVIQRVALRTSDPYLTVSTALSDLAVTADSGARGAGPTARRG